MSDLICLGEPLIELNGQADGLYQMGFGGDVSNVAIAAARQGTRTGMITHVGADRFGKDLITLWHREKVDTTFVRAIEGQDTGLYFVHHDEDGHHFTYRRRGSACSRIDSGDIPEQAILGAGMFYTSAIGLAVSGSLRAATFDAMSLAGKNNVQVAFDPNLREQLWPLEQARQVTHEAMTLCDIALPGLDDARRLTGLHTPDEIIGFYHSLGARVVALTLGSAGVAVSTGDAIATLPAFKVNAVDATGAGDCFNGVFLSGLLRGVHPEEAARTANAGAAVSTTGFGAVAPIPYPDDIQKLKDQTA